MDALKLDELLPYLVNRLGPRVEAGFAGPLRANGITLPMWRVLAVLRVSGPMGLNDLGAGTSLPLSTLSRLVGDMVSRGLLSRIRKPDDARAVEVDLTDRGRAVANAVTPLARHYETAMARGFARAELAELRRLLIKLYANMDGIETTWRAAAE